MKTHEEKVNRILRDAFEKGLIEPSSMSPAELGKAIKEELEANPPTLMERMWANLYYAVRFNLKRGK
jgi:hypothetical protein